MTLDKISGPKTDKCIHEWFCKVWNYQIPVYRKMVKSKSLEVVRSLEIKIFKASNK